MIFDVGANLGQSTEAYLDHAPDAQIYALEPSPDSFAALSATYGTHPRVTCINRAASRAAGKVHFLAKGTRTDNRIVAEGNEHTVSVEASPGDALLPELGLERIDYLKIDTEGHELDVIGGFMQTLLAARVRFVELELGMHAENRRHVPFERAHGLMDTLGYPLYHLQEFAWERRAPFTLRRVNAVFAARA